MQITDVTSADEGEWSCELEEYRLLGRGNKDKKSLTMKISDQSRGELPPTGGCRRPPSSSLC